MTIYNNREILWIIRFRDGSILVEFVDTSHPQDDFLHELINYGYKVISSFVDIKEYTKLCPQEFV